ncbi:triose-phosphate isomerase [Rhodospirillum rubrum]|uniref:Triosephosphate isomerase n=1 Tax=Rhodospirillum rubrum (strain ATCC 11170 / ATH 1.1.1 / DSM 467 / LMG 4362 / NCIMB 8255 / S1) TaxID=269796 RepID=Q2RUN6_RHORT|nr:triose-phosphate isomerase [Rhodospirillum rubrum]ABC22159.1 triosephosphate isomerase [Rhodospirillum rubrum ATCC 11170]AEO47873.1 triosephosphate isomerase [Rhodospirillum rubrum F11]MBK5953747.1 triose-phosphate isomerase [Rhodospirillum rubrum]QXG81807.1 triose-phosphate isomerase [Rhodospirillum rubrum]HAP98959.1 triose-phosphate isomerase [Rhodospirillum rubrum]
MNARLWIGTSWKMHKTIAEAEAYVGELTASPLLDRVEAFIVPPFTALAAVHRALGDAPVHLGAQTMHWQDEGAQTGEISPLMLRDCGVGIVELGHSERRASHGETDATVNAKVASALRHGLRPLICVGDQGDDLDAGASIETVLRQVKLAIKGIDTASLGRALIAYEPVWAIGEAGRPAEPAHVAEVHGALRAMLGQRGLAALPLLYGGSVDRANAGALTALANVDGLFVGRAAWTARGFEEVIEAALHGAKDRAGLA